MKKLLFIFILLSFLTSCGPHRMQCGPRGNCNASEKQILNQFIINHNTQIVKIFCPEISLHKSVKIWKDIQENTIQNGNLYIQKNLKLI